MLLKYTCMHNGVVLVRADEQKVRWCWCMLEYTFVSFLGVPSMHFDTIEIQHSRAINWNTLQWRLHGTVSVSGWFRMSRKAKYVDIAWFSFIVAD